MHKEIDNVADLKQITIFELFGGSLGGLSWSQKGSKFPILLIITHKTSKFACVDSFSPEIRCCCTFNRIIQLFDLFRELGVEWVSVVIHSCSILNHRCLWFCRFHKLIWKLLLIEPQIHTFTVYIPGPQVQGPPRYKGQFA